MSKRPIIKPATIKMMRKRKEWRTRALSCAIEFSTYPAGKPKRDEVARALDYSLNKVHRWFRHREAVRVVSAIQRRAVNAFRNQMGNTQ